MNTTETKIYIEGQPVEGLTYGISLEPETDGQYADDLPAIVTAQRAEFTATVTMTPEQAARMIELVSPFALDFTKAYRETVAADPKRWHIFSHTKRARIRKKYHKAFVAELVERIEAQAKAREDHAAL